MINLLTLCLLILIVWFARPVAGKDYQLPEIEQQIVNSEMSIPGLVPGTEKKITWYAKPGVKTDYAIVYLHGFGASRQETFPLTDNVAQALHANTFQTRLSGHGLDGEKLADVSMEQWLADTREAVEIGSRLGDRLVLIGVSTGGTLATWAAAQRSLGRQLSAMVLISPNFELAQKSAYWLQYPLLMKLTEWLAGPNRRWEPESEIHARYWNYEYPWRALLPMMQLIESVRQLEPASITIPVLTFFSDADEVVDAAEIQRRVALFGSARNEMVRHTPRAGESSHVLAGDIMSPGSTNTIAERIEKFLASL